MPEKRKVIFDAVIIFLSVSFVFWWLIFVPPRDFPADGFTTIEKGETLSDIGKKLKNDGVIKSENIFTALAKVLGAEKKIKSGDYFFEKPLSLIEIVNRLGSGEFGLGQIKIVIPEGADLEDIADFFSTFKSFSKEEFLHLSREGYLFPDTYFFFPNVNAVYAVKIMEDNFENKINPLMPEIQKSGHSLEEIITMASLIEKEVSDSNDRKIVSGILWKRLGIGMPLQVDAAKDTYLYKGLPLAPICNPGLDAINAALHPLKTEYLYYLSDRDGKTYFAETFEEHKLNKIRYLR